MKANSISDSENWLIPNVNVLNKQRKICCRSLRSHYCIRCKKCLAFKFRKLITKIWVLRKNKKIRITCHEKCEKKNQGSHTGKMNTMICYSWMSELKSKKPITKIGTSYTQAQTTNNLL